jgi:hypothetical protein
MVGDPSSPLPEFNPKRSVRSRPLEGEVLPPTVRIKAAEASPPPPPGAAPPYRLRLSTALAAGGATLAVLVGLLGGAYAFLSSRHGADAEEATFALARLQDEVARLRAGVDTLHPATDLARQEEAVRAVKRSVDGLKAELDALRSNSQTALAQVSAKLDKPDPSPRLSDIAARLDRIEKQVSSPIATGSITPPPRPAPAAAQQTVATQTVEKPAPKSVTLGNWVLRDVYDGIALVEAREGGVREVAPGEFLPGAGEVRSIERRGRAWVVVTSRGIIDNATW